MTRKYSLVIEGDDAGYSAYVAGLPAIMVTGNSIDELTERATEAIQLYCEHLGRRRPHFAERSK
jgi:predicted RNase H-like HicB family nuclease